MKKLKTTDITPTVGMPIKGGTLLFLQEAYQEGLKALANGIVEDEDNFTILWGCVNSTTAPIYTVSAGAIYYQGEVYLVDAFTFTSGGGDVAVGTITTTQFTDPTADPVTFTNTLPYNVHDIRKIVFASAASASGDVDFADLVQRSGTRTLMTMLNSYTTSSFANAKAAYRRDGFGNVFLNGWVQSPSGAVGSTIFFQLPANCRPLSQQVFLTQFPAAGTSTVVMLVIETTGDCKIMTLSGGATIPSSVAFYLTPARFNVND